MRKGCVYCGLAVAEFRPRHGRPDPNHPGMELAAAAGHPAALYDLGAEALDRGDREVGSDYFRRAVELGSGAAAKELGVRFQFGYGLPIDEREAFRWYCAAAEEDHPRGTCIAGLCLLAGTGCDRDDRKGERFLQRAAALGDAAAHWHLARHAAKPAARAASWLADLYTVPEAVGHLELGAKLGHPLCQLWVAQARLADLNPAIPDEVMFGWLIRDDAKWDRRADFLASGFLEYGIGVPRDDLRAFRLCLKAAKFGEARAARRLTEFYKVECEYSAPPE